MISVQLVELLWIAFTYLGIEHFRAISLLPFIWGPRFGINLQHYPLLDFVVELLFCIACWKIFAGSRGLVGGIVVFSLTNIPLMFPRPGSLTPIVEHPMLLPTVFLIQVVASWILVWWLSQRTVLSPNFLDRTGSINRRAAPTLRG